MRISKEESFRIRKTEDHAFPRDHFRFFRPMGGSDSEVRLQQLFLVGFDGQEEWIDVPVVMED